MTESLGSKVRASVVFPLWRGQAGIDDKVINKGILVYNGTSSFPVSDKIRVVPAAEILTTGAKW